MAGTESAQGYQCRACRAWLIGYYELTYINGVGPFCSDCVKKGKCVARFIVTEKLTAIEEETR